MCISSPKCNKACEKCCNSHDALLDACKVSLKQLLSIATELDLPTEPQLDYLKAAIAEAEKKA